MILEQWIGSFNSIGVGDGTTVAVSADCTLGACNTFTNPWPRKIIPEDSFTKVRHEFAAVLSGTEKEVSDDIFLDASLEFWNPAAPDDIVEETVESDFNLPIRCDYQAAGLDAPHYGCVYKKFISVHEVPMRILPAYAGHIADAQATGLPGAPSEGSNVLKRLRDQAKIDRNRTKACAAAPSPRPDGLECDEYPFASTYQGASTANPPIGWSWRLISAAENGAGGEHLKRFYRAFRIHDKDPFWVKVIAG